MKKKIIIVVTLVVALALGGTLVFAAVDEDGNWTNPFTNILSSKVEDGIITQEDADTFAKVWTAIRGDREDDGVKGMAGKTCRPDGLKKRPEINIEFMEEYKAVFEDKTDEIKSSLVEKGILDADAVEDNSKGPLFSKDMDEETLEAIKEAMADVKVFMNEFVDSKVADGTITQEEADLLLEIGKGRTRFPCDNMKGGSAGKRMPGRTRNQDEADDDPGA